MSTRLSIRVKTQCITKSITKFVHDIIVVIAAMQVNDIAECSQIDSTGHSDEDVVYALA
jgi:hypothetical protein